MSDLLERARNSKKETKQIEFKRGFDPSSNGEWCEIIKDVVAIANSGSGIIVFGVNDDGTLSGVPLDAVSRIDLADLSNKITKYTGCVDPLVEIQDVEREGHQLPAFMIQPSDSLLVFGTEGAYVDKTGKQKSAFAKGTVYFRHGAKSEPGTTEDVRSAFERRLNQERRSWLKQVKKVVSAPAGSQFVIQASVDRPTLIQSGIVRNVNNDPTAIPVILTRDSSKGGGTYLHEEVSEGILDEINNVIDLNKSLAKGQPRFLWMPQVYYRVYAERYRVRQDQDQIEMLFHTGSCEINAPNLFWALELDAGLVAKNIVTTYLAPKNPQIYWFMRIAVLLGSEFCNWVYQRWDKKWHGISQAPRFYFSFGEMIKSLNSSDQRLCAVRLSPSVKLTVPGQPGVACSELIRDPRIADALLSAACMAVFDGNSELKQTARILDYFAHGSEVVRRGKQIAEAVMKVIGNRQPGDHDESTLAEE
jgi:hypothetical protein